MKKLKVILIGAGGRGTEYTDIMATMSDMYQVVAVAEPVKSRREHVRELHGISDDMCFEDYHPLLALGKIADIAIISTLDRMHYEPAMMAIDAGYDLLLEKPIAPTYEECVKITENAEKHNVKVLICTVLRYTKFFNSLRNIIKSGKLGKVLAINHEENVGNIHFSHSFCRSNWGNAGRSSEMLLQKSCHDMDILYWLVGGKKCLEVQSFGHLSYFKKENAPEGSPEYCIDGCPVSDSCPYNAVRLYLENKTDWMRNACANEYKPSDEQIKAALKNTQHGKCIFKCDNDVVDHQTVNLRFEDDLLITFSMNPFGRGGRYIHIMGTEGELRAHMDENSPIEIYDTHTEKLKESIDYMVVQDENEDHGGSHGGGDRGIVEALYRYIAYNDKADTIPDIRESLYTHYITFSADRSRTEGKSIKI